MESPCGNCSGYGRGDASWLGCCLCHAEASLLCKVTLSVSRAAPHPPQNCSSAINLLPQFQQATLSPALATGVSILLLLSLEISAGASFAIAARLGRNFSIAANIEECSSAMAFFMADSEARPIASVTRPAI